MAALFKVFWQIALLRKGPQVLPASRELMLVVLAAHWLLGVVLVVDTFSLDRALLSGLVGTLILVATVHGLLVLRHRHSRVTQTLSALAGCEVLLGLLMLPLLAMLHLGGGAQSMAALFWLLLIGWNVAIAAHIFRHALEVKQGLGLLFGVAYIILSMTLTSFLVPMEAPV